MRKRELNMPLYLCLVVLGKPAYKDIVMSVHAIARRPHYAILYMR